MLVKDTDRWDISIDSLGSQN